MHYEFPCLHSGITFLNHAAVSPIPDSARRAIREAADLLAESGPVEHAKWFARLKQARERAAALLHCAPGEVAFMRNTTGGLLTVAEGIEWKPGDNVLLPAGDFPSNRYPWLGLQRRGVEIRYVQPAPGQIGLTADDFVPLIDSRTRVVSVSWVHYATGFRIALEPLGELCAQRGALFVVDAIQGLGAIPLNVKAAKIDYLSADGHKWLLGPEGAGVFYASDDAKDRLDYGLKGWLGVPDPLAFHLEQEPTPEARRFEEGALNMLGIFGLSESMRVLLETGIESVWRAICNFNDELVDGLRAKGYTIDSPLLETVRSGILSVSRQGVNADETVRRLQDGGIFISSRDGRLRISPHFYNTRQDIRRLLDALP
ncbi:aminotransferase class V-fold PLP-dependent enzyme [Candidatus Sumerlaeota bacterium]|nr:aminotransferase class V-fold PLP-dependent enzyme [Candidatus Sumerlaeota bacterium]